MTGLHLTFNCDYYKKDGFDADENNNRGVADNNDNQKVDNNQNSDRDYIKEQKKPDLLKKDSFWIKLGIQECFFSP